MPFSLFRAQRALEKIGRVTQWVQSGGVSVKEGDARVARIARRDVAPPDFDHAGFECSGVRSTCGFGGGGSL